MNPTSIVLPTTNARQASPAPIPAPKQKSARRVPPAESNHQSLKGVAPDTHPKVSAPTAEIRHDSFAHNATEETTFHVNAPGAKEVLLAGEFTNWEKSAVKLTKGGGGVWHVKVPLPPGRHEYRFLVDGQWQDDQNRPERVPNSYGTNNSVVVIK